MAGAGDAQEREEPPNGAPCLWSNHHHVSVAASLGRGCGRHRHAGPLPVHIVHIGA